MHSASCLVCRRCHALPAKEAVAAQDNRPLEQACKWKLHALLLACIDPVEYE